MFKALIACASTAFSALIVVSAHAYEPERAQDNYAHELAQCSAYLTVAEGCIENTDPGGVAGEPLRSAAIAAYAMAVKSSSEDVAAARVKLEIDAIDKLIENQCSNISIAIVKYNDDCTQAIGDPETRYQYWLDKEDQD